MKRLFYLLALLAMAAPAAAQCLPIPNGDTRALVWSVFDGKPFNQATLVAAEPFLNSYGIQITPPNAVGERTKLGDPLTGEWWRVGFGEGHPVWLGPAGQYAPIACAAQPVPLPPPVVTPPVPAPAPVVIDVAAILAKMDEIERKNDANTARLEAAINEPGWFKTFFSNRYVQMALGVVAGWLGTKAAQ